VSIDNQQQGGKPMPERIYNGLDWEKVASVTTGGKPYFYVAHAYNQTGNRVKYTVVWNRIKQCWTAEYDDYTLPKAIELGSFNSAHYARTRAVNHCQQVQL
jgi:hypothetical protein